MESEASKTTGLWWASCLATAMPLTPAPIMAIFETVGDIFGIASFGRDNILYMCLNVREYKLGLLKQRERDQVFIEGFVSGSCRRHAIGLWRTYYVRVIRLISDWQRWRSRSL